MRHAAKDSQISWTTTYTRPDIWAAPWSSQLRLICHWHGYNTCPAAKTHRVPLDLQLTVGTHAPPQNLALCDYMFVLISSQLRCLSSVTLPRWLWWWVCQPEGKHTSPRSSLATWTGSEWLQRVSSHSEMKLNGGMRSSHLEYLVPEIVFWPLCLSNATSVQCRAVPEGDGQNLQELWVL